MNYAPIKQLIAIEIKTLDQLISKNLLLCSSVTIQDIAQYIIFSGGKRIRPYLLLLLCRLFDYQNDDRHIKLAAVLELIHTATLLHDDVIDNSNLRRNKPSAHLKWGIRDSISAGNWLFAMAFKLVVSCNSMHLTRVVCAMTKTMAEGELAQLTHKNAGLKDPKSHKITEADYYQIIMAKTGVLFAASTELAAIVCGQSAELIAKTREFGMHLGLAFQITDDLLDYTSSAANLGKNVGDDLAEGKVTLPLIYLQERSPEEFRRVTEGLKSCAPNTVAFTSKFQEIKLLLDKHNCIKDAYSKAELERDCAIQALNALPNNKYAEYLRAIALDSVARLN